jgi:processive 1,2-diacylglycerol beta-glucosyltransferase
LKEIDPEVETFSINGFGYTYPLLEKIVNKAYMSVIKTTPQVWDYLYDNPKIVKNTQSLKQFLNTTSHKKIEQLLTKYNPDVIVCTQAFPCGMVADYKKAHGADFKLIGVLTDYAPHAYWINDGVDYYVVPSIESKERFMVKGVNADAIKVYGIPIRPQFATQLDKNPIAQKLGLNLNIPTILIMGGGQGLGPIRSVVRNLIALETPLQLIVLTGTNVKAYERLQKIAQKSSKKILVYQYVNTVDELMDLATLIITKPGGLTTAECLAKGLPMVIVKPIPGQEARNTDYLIKNGIAIRVDDPDNIAEEIDLLLNASGRLDRMSRAAYEHAKPFATTNICKLILNSNPE